MVNVTPFSSWKTKQRREVVKTSLVVRFMKTFTFFPFGQSLSKARIGEAITVRQAHRER